MRANQQTFNDSDNGVIVYIGSDTEPFHIRRNGFDFREGSILCKELSNETLEYYDFMGNTNDLRHYEMRCNDDDVRACDCNFNGPDDDNEDIVGVSCLPSNDVVGSLRLLPDGRVIELFEDDEFGLPVWAHYCINDNDGWNQEVAELACQNLGFDGLNSSNPNSFRISIWEDEGDRNVYGLRRINCDGASTFSSCIKETASFNARCDNQGVIGVQCEHRLQTSSTMLATGILSASSSLLQATPSITNIPSSVQDTVTPLTQQFITPSMSQLFIPLSVSQQVTPSEVVLTPSMSPSENQDTASIGNIESTQTVAPTASNTQDDRLTKIIAIVASLMAFLIIILIIVTVLIIIISVFKRRRNKKARRMSDDHNNNNTHYANIDPGSMGEFLPPREQNIEGVTGTRTEKSREEYEIMAPVVVLEELGGTNFYETINPPKEKIYDQVVHQFGMIVPSLQDREYLNLSKNDLIAKSNNHHSNTQLSCFIYQNDSEFWAPEDTETAIYTQMSIKRYREINPEEMIMDKIIGSGKFGCVHNGIWRTQKAEVPVAIKTIKGDAIDSNVGLLQEAAILGQFNHPNVLKLLGVVTIVKPMMMVTELMKTGLTDFLDIIDHSNSIPLDTMEELFLRFSLEIANGMEHLASKKYVHRDLAARNILINHSISCKIADFGLARGVGVEEVYYVSKGGLVPLKWTAPEAILYMKYSEKSDVFSYGVTLFEIWSIGERPWKGVPNGNVSLI